MFARQLQQIYRPLSRAVPKTGRFYSSAPPWTVSEEVVEAVRSGKPVVALETAIYTHGFPYPENIALASSLESLVRKHGAVPATMGILNGVCRVGMQPEEIVELLEKVGSPDLRKVSRRDLAILCSTSKYSGGTTIAGGLVMAHLAGIKIFATGGLGGVHRDKPGETSMDVSADLIELGRTPVALISSGCKSFLDIPRTLEVLETHGVGVSTFADGRQGPVDWPAFWTRDSGIPSPNTVQDEKHAASIIYAQRNFPLTSGLVFANPIPAEFSVPAAQIDAITARAVEEAAANGITGSANTPYILSKIKELSTGATVTANRALVESNIIRGAKVAVELAKLEKQSRLDHFPPASVFISSPTNNTVDVLVAGSVAIDMSCDYAPVMQDSRHVSMHTSNPALVHQSLGGVGSNVARACHGVGAGTILSSVVGKDAAAQSVISALKEYGMDTSGIMDGGEGSRTARYIAVNDLDKSLVIAMADMNILESSAQNFEATWGRLLRQQKPKWVVVDANWSPEVLHSWVRAARELGTKIAFEPVSIEKSTRLLSSHGQPTQASVSDASDGKSAQHGLVDLATPNTFEVLKMSETMSSSDTWSRFIDSLGDSGLESAIEPMLRDSSIDGYLDIVRASLKLLGQIPCVLTKLGPKGVLQTEMISRTDPRLSRASLQSHIVFCSDDVRSTLNIDSKRTADVEQAEAALGGMGAVLIKHHPGLQIDSRHIRSVNGVGDTFLGVLVASLATAPAIDMDEAILRAQKAALMTLQSQESVSPDLHVLMASGKEPIL